LFLAWLGLASTAGAHPLAPSSLVLDASAAPEVSAVFRTPRSAAGRVEPVLPDGCRLIGAVRASLDGGARVVRFRAHCEALVGRSVGVSGLDQSGTNALLHVILPNGREVRAVLTRDTPQLLVPEAESRLQVMRSYGALGVRHLLTGLDHVLFLLGLLLILPTWRALAVAVTGFTLGHSLTLAAATLTGPLLPPALVELAIAASLIVVAREAFESGPSSLLARRPALVPLAFGLVHGLGFASALANLGLPGHALPLALFSFNVGIELAQLAFVALAWPLVQLATGRLPARAFELPATAVGAFGVFLLLTRASQWLSS
jgi:hypothetical protein